MTAKLRVLVLWSRPSGYLDACLDALAGTRKADVLFVGQSSSRNEAPFDLSLLQGHYRSIYLEKPVDYEALAGTTDEFRPHVVLAGGSWRERSYRKLLRNFNRKACRILCMDTLWTGHWRQRLALPAMRATRSAHYDKAFVAGDRQANYAKRMGFATTNIQTGLYSCDHGSFSAAAGRWGDARFATPSFLYVGRLINIKGIPELLEGYTAYRDRTSNPWPLHVCGTGPLESQLRQAEGVRHLGFVQPNDLPNVMASHTTLVLPSRSEPWGLVIHEAVSAGMSVICSAVCGAGDYFVQSGHNGHILASTTPEQIAASFAQLSEAPQQKLVEMSAASRGFAARNTPVIWANKVLAFQNAGAATVPLDQN